MLIADTPLMLSRYRPMPRGKDDDPLYNNIGQDLWLNVLAHLDFGVLTFSYDAMWRNSTQPTCYRHMVPITVTKLGRGFIVGRERVISKVSRSFTAPPPPPWRRGAPAATTATVIYYYEKGLLVDTQRVSGETVSLSLRGAPGSAEQQLGIIVWGARR